MPPCPMPASFNVSSYDAVGQTLGRVNVGKPGWSGYANGWNGVAYRFRAAHEASERYTTSIRRDRFANAERYEQEEALCSFFFNSLSSLECFCYAMYHVGAAVGRSEFKIATDQDLKWIDINSTNRAFEAAFPSGGLTKALSVCAGSSERDDLEEYRNALSHRGSVPRQNFLGSFPPGSTIHIPADTQEVRMTAKPRAAPVPGAIGPTVSIDDQTTSSRLAWLTATLNGLLVQAEAFCSAEVR
jgi:hypothetical protein